MDLHQLRERAQHAAGDELWTYVRDAHPAIVNATIFNRHLTVDMAVFLAKTVRTNPETLGILASDFRFKDSYPLKVALARNPKTPQKVTFSLLKFLRIFDIGDLTKDNRLPIAVRQRAEFSLSEKLPALPSGVKSALAKRSSSVIIMRLLQKGDARVIDACLQSPLITEGHICSLVNSQTTGHLLIRMIAESRKWTLRYSVRYALVRNFFTPMVHVVDFIRNLTSVDIRDLFHDSEVPLSTKPFLYRELVNRGESAEQGISETYDLSQYEDTGADGLFSSDIL